MEKVSRGTGGKAQVCEMCFHRCSVLHGKRTESRAPSSFFKIMVPSTMDDTMQLPPKFAFHIGNLIDHESYLEDLSGGRWHVKLCNVEGSLAFKHGWREFVRDHSLQYGDLLLFRYMDSHFLVEIFGKTACEKLNFLEAEIGNSRKVKQNRKRKNVEQLHPKSTVSGTGVLKENGGSLHKKQRFVGSNTRESPREKPNSPEGMRKVDHQSSCRHLKSSMTEKGRSMKWNTPDTTTATVQLPSTHKDSGHANARKVVSSTIRQVPMTKPRNNSKSPASEEVHRKKYLCKGNVVLLDSDSEDMETEPATIGASSKHNNGSKVCVEPEDQVGTSHGHSPDEERDIREKSSSTFQSERMSDDLDDLHSIHNEDSSHYVQKAKSMPFVKAPRAEMVLNGSIAKCKAQAQNSTGKAFHDKNASIQGHVNLSNTVMVEGDFDGDTVDRGSMLAENSFLCHGNLRETQDTSEKPSKVILSDMTNKEDVGEITLNMPVFVTEEEGNTQDLVRSLRVSENSFNCDGAAKRTGDVAEEFPDNMVPGSESNEPKKKNCNARDNNVEMKVGHPQCCTSHKESVVVEGDGDIGSTNAVMGNMEDVTKVPETLKLASHPEGSLGRVLLVSLDDAETMHLAGQHTDRHCLRNRDVSNSSVGTEQSANDNSNTWKKLEPLSFDTSKVTVKLEPLSFVSSKEAVQVTVREKGSQTSLSEAGKRKYQTKELEGDLNSAVLNAHCSGSLRAPSLEEEYAEAIPVECSSRNEVVFESSAGIECSTFGSSNTCEIFEIPVQATWSVNMSDMVTLETRERKFCTKEVKREPKCAELPLNSEDSLVGAKLRLDTDNAEVVHLAHQHIGKYPPANGDNPRSLTGIQCTDSGSIRTCKAPAVPPGIDVSLNAAGNRSAACLETRKSMCQIGKVKRETNTFELDFSCEDGSSKTNGSEAEYVEIVIDQHIEEHPSGAGKEHNLVPKEPSIKESQHCDGGPSPVRYECLVSVKTLSQLDLPSDFPTPVPQRKNQRSIIILSDANMNWWPILYYEKRNSQKSLSSGWKHFAAANDIREGDVCLLQVTDKSPDTFHVKLRKQLDTP